MKKIFLLLILFLFFSIKLHAGVCLHETTAGSLTNLFLICSDTDVYGSVHYEPFNSAGVPINFLACHWLTAPNKCWVTNLGSDFDCETNPDTCNTDGTPIPDPTCPTGYTINGTCFDTDGSCSFGCTGLPLEEMKNAYRAWRADLPVGNYETVMGEKNENNSYSFTVRNKDTNEFYMCLECWAPNSDEVTARQAMADLRGEGSDVFDKRDINIDNDIFKDADGVYRNHKIGSDAVQATDSVGNTKIVINSLDATYPNSTYQISTDKKNDLTAKSTADHPISQGDVIAGKYSQGSTTVGSAGGQTAIDNIKQQAGSITVAHFTANTATGTLKGHSLTGQVVGSSTVVNSDGSSAITNADIGELQNNNSSETIVAGVGDGSGTSEAGTGSEVVDEFLDDVAPSSGMSWGGAYSPVYYNVKTMVSIYDDHKSNWTNSGIYQAVNSLRPPNFGSSLPSYSMRLNMFDVTLTLDFQDYDYIFDVIGYLVLLAAAYTSYKIIIIKKG